jgi:D-alanyl-D-alanine endopeptidase (penicillin-binding protein 7)
MQLAWLGVLLMSVAFPGVGGLVMPVREAVQPGAIVSRTVVATPAPTRLPTESLGVVTSAERVLAIDPASGATLYAQNERSAAPIASITKLMTALVWLDAQRDPLELITITKEDLRPGGLQLLVLGDVLTAQQLFSLMLVASPNEAAAALARTIGSEEFITRMNQTANRLGMLNTQFVEPTGLDPRNVASAHDVSLLAQAAFARPQIAAAVRQQKLSFMTQGQRAVNATSTDQLLESFINRDAYRILGGKTGSLGEAGYCLVFLVERQGGARLVVVLLGSATPTDRWRDAKSIVQWVFDNYRWPTPAA